MPAQKKYLSPEEIKALEALYKRHTQKIPASTSGEIVEVIYKNWETLAGLFIKYAPLKSKNKLKYTTVRSKDQPNPRGEAYIKYTVSHQYRLQEGDFDLLMENCVGYGYYDDKALTKAFGFGYGHSGLGQFRISTDSACEDNKRRELSFKSLEHTTEELEELGTLLAQLLG